MAAAASKVGILAGGGDLPLRLADACRTSGRPFLIVGFEGHADKAIEAYPHVWTGLGSVGRTFKLLRDGQCKDIVLAGRVTRPDFASLKLDWKGARLLPKVLAAARRGDGYLLSALVEDLEGEGFRVIGTQDVFAGLLARSATLTRQAPGERDMKDIARAREVVTLMGRHDIGQGAVVCEGLVLAVEAAEGTDAMLERCALLREEIRGSSAARRGVLVKWPKPIQELRVDLPTIGVRTIDLAAAAGLSGIAIKAGASIILDEAGVVQRADEMGLFLVGLTEAAGEP